MYLIREMQISDIPEVLEIEEDSFSSPWTEAAFVNELLNPCAYYYVWEENKRVIGYAGFWKILEDINITNIAFKSEQRGKGKGSALLLFVMDAARKLGAEAVTLEVRESNAAAIAVYHKNGFYSAGIRKDYYTKPTENALIMWAKVKKEESHEDGTKSN
ncbi:ribosomal-protein-alanine N-acetyltransferase [Clostridiales bacterium COT073_COT-073]|nr:ribosomal-protein-alanine N-acetyltransferase [Clostridiales bacterium COT073_COT-073]